MYYCLKEKSVDKVLKSGASTKAQIVVVVAAGLWTNLHFDLLIKSESFPIHRNAVHKERIDSFLYFFNLFHSEIFLVGSYLKCVLCSMI